MELRRDGEVVLAAVKTRGIALKYASPFLRALLGNWNRVCLFFIGQADNEACLLSWLPVEVVRGPLLLALLKAL